MIDYIRDSSILPTSVIAETIKIQSKNLLLTPLYFCRTGKNSIAVLFEFDLKVKAGSKSDGNVSKNLDETTYFKIKEMCTADSISDESFLKEYKQNIKEFLDYDRNIFHSLHSMKTKDIMLPSIPHEHITLVTMSSYVTYEFEFDNSRVINKMVLSLPDKYLGRYFLGDEKRTDVLLQDKEA